MNQNHIDVTEQEEEAFAVLESAGHTITEPKLSPTDLLLQQLADHVTKDGLTYIGAVFEHMPTGKEFTLTVSDTSKLNDSRMKLINALGYLDHYMTMEEAIERVDELRKENQELRSAKGKPHE